MPVVDALPSLDDQHRVRQLVVARAHAGAIALPPRSKATAKYAMQGYKNQKAERKAEEAEAEKGDSQR